MIVGSILLAFGIEAWWANRQERQDEAILLADLTEEFRDNRVRLENVTNRNRTRVERLGILIREAGPEAEGLHSDSLNTLARSVLTNPNFGAETGVMERTMSGNGLSLLRDRDLRGDLAGFWSRFQFYFNNQSLITRQLVFTAPVAFGTGTLVWQTYPHLESLGSTTMWSDPLTPDQVDALKYFSMTHFIGGLLVSQGENMLIAIDTLMADLDRASSR